MNIKLLKQKDFFLLIMGETVSLIGTIMQNFALSLYVLAITHSTVKFASVTAITIFPKLILGPFSGVIADRFNRKKIIVGTDLINGILMGIYALLFFINGHLSLLSIYILVISITITNIIFEPAIQTVIPSIVEKESLVDANSIDTLFSSLSNILALALGAILYDNLGIGVIFIINSISFILSAISEIFINIPKNNLKNDKLNLKMFFSDFKEGITCIKNEKLIFNILIIMIFINFAFNPIFKIGLPYISIKVLDGNGIQYSVLRIAIILSGITASLISSKLCKKYTINKLLIRSGLIISLCMFLISFSISKIYLNIFSNTIVPFITILIICFLMMMTATLCNIAAGTIIQETISLDMLGRIQSVIMMVCTVAVPAGEMFFGFMFDATSPAITIGISSCIIFVTVLLSSKYFLISNDKRKIKN